MKIVLIILGLLSTALAAPAEPEQAAKLLQVAQANDAFDMHLLQTLEQEAAGKNVFISAFSISSALAMLMAGGKEKTYTEIYNTLGYSASHFSNDDVMLGYQKLMTDLNNPTKTAGNILSVANSVAVQKNREILESYINSVTTYFGSQVFVEDFASNAAAQHLNSWVSDKTHGKIPKLFDSLPHDTAMVLLNAIYFKGTWEHKFEEKSTKSDTFHVTKDQVEQVEKMIIRDHLSYATFEDGELLEIPYKNRTLSMFVFLPAQNRQSQTLSTVLNAVTLEARVQALQVHEVNLHLPKFKFEGTYSLKPTLQTLGVHDTFTKAADFSNIDGKKDLYVDAVVHKTFIEVNEEGSEAAAATAIVVRPKAAVVGPPPRIIEFNVDRPFLFFIRDNEYHLSLFSGIINKPEYSK